ncbi:helix-turn-helix transcriptional regulator [Streptomyces sp. NPDC007861]|uniref:helix-turn-helix domain-containing protein n=1 Tax=Streptomyces sp. NPDC007861 TaxID=3154893 RepID=UPI0033F6A4F3
MAAGTDGFAGLLGALKERSGRSYGALARQLHMSTSTLHRYCNGDAVPTEYAPVERFARLCGATSEELVELHRQWILADEARRRGRVAEPAAEADPTPPTPVADAPSEAVDAAPEPVVIGPQPGSRKRRLRIAVATAAVVAVAVPVTFAMSRLGGDEPATEARGRGQAPGGASAGTSTGTSVSPSLTPSLSVSASPSASSSGSASPSAASAATERPQPAAGQGRGAAPSVGISSYNWDAPCGEDFLLDQQPNQVPPPPAPQDTRGWARALGGVSGGNTQLQLTVTGNTDESVVLTALNVRVVGRKAPLAWQAYSMGEGCGSGVTPQTFAIDLDAARPLTKAVAGQDGDTVVPAKEFPYKVSTRDPQVLNLDVHTEAHEVTWYLEVAWSSGDRHGTVRVDDGGKPFRTSALEGRQRYFYWPDKGEWGAG